MINAVAGVERTETIIVLSSVREIWAIPAAASGLGLKAAAVFRNARARHGRQSQPSYPPPAGRFADPVV